MSSNLHYFVIYVFGVGQFRSPSWFMPHHLSRWCAGMSFWVWGSVFCPVTLWHITWLGIDSAIFWLVGNWKAILLYFSFLFFIGKIFLGGFTVIITIVSELGFSVKSQLGPLCGFCRCGCFCPCDGLKPVQATRVFCLKRAGRGFSRPLWQWIGRSRNSSRWIKNFYRGTILQT